jgi:hypothetical protein
MPVRSEEPLIDNLAHATPYGGSVHSISKHETARSKESESAVWVSQLADLIVDLMMYTFWITEWG